MVKRTLSHIYIAEAEPLPGGKYHAVYSSPGRLPTVATREDGRPYLYNTQIEAEAGAARQLHRVLNAPRSNPDGKTERYQKLTGAEFAVLLANADVTATWFAYVYGTAPKRVLGWIDGVDDVPHPARLLLEAIIASPQIPDLIESVTDRVTTELRPRRKEV